jgi:DNA-binding CsgD family transcriptional regulator
MVPAQQICAAFSELGALETPEQIVETLNQLVQAHLGVGLYGIWRLPRNPADYSDGYPVGRSVFIHEASRAAYDEHMRRARERGPNVLSRASWVARRPYTITDCLREERPNSAERWAVDLLLAHGIRDGLYCPCDEWIVLYRSAGVLRLSAEVRVLLQALARRASMRLDEVVQLPPERLPVRLSAREKAVLQCMANGCDDPQIAAQLGIAEPTVRTHVQRAMTKLDTKHRGHTIAEAMRRGLIR